MPQSGNGRRYTRHWNRWYFMCRGCDRIHYGRSLCGTGWLRQSFQTRLYASPVEGFRSAGRANGNLIPRRDPWYRQKSNNRHWEKRGIKSLTHLVYDFLFPSYSVSILSPGLRLILPPKHPQRPNPHHRKRHPHQKHAVPPQPQLDNQPRKHRGQTGGHIGAEIQEP